jgi:hypothetical protein
MNRVTIDDLPFFFRNGQEIFFAKGLGNGAKNLGGKGGVCTYTVKPHNEDTQRFVSVLHPELSVNFLSGKN